MTDIVNPIDPPVVPPVPQRNDEETFEDRSDAGWEFAFNTLPSYMQDTMDNVHQNAVATNERALAADQRATDAETAKQAAEDARDAAAVHEQGAEDAKESAWVAAAAAGVSAGLPQPLVPGKVLGVTSAGLAAWIDGGDAAFFEFTSSGVFDIPDWAKFIYVEAIGGGGGGGSVQTSGGDPRYGTGGGGGEFNFCLLLATDVPASIVVTVGAGGAPGAYPSNSRAPSGGDSMFGSLLIARGGEGGLSTMGSSRDGGKGGGGQLGGRVNPTIGSLHDAQGGFSSGGGGAENKGGSSTAGGAGGGVGGISARAGDGGAGAVNANAGNGEFPGGGGGATYRNTAGSSLGGSGAPGVVRVWCW